MAEGLAKAGQIADALDAIDHAIARAERTEELWQFAEFRRVMFYYRQRWEEPQLQPRVSSGRRSTGPADKAPFPGSCVPPPASLVSGAIKAVSRGGRRSSSRSTTALQRVSAPPI
jgi:hypothetical protein